MTATVFRRVASVIAGALAVMQSMATCAAAGPPFELTAVKTPATLGIDAGRATPDAPTVKTQSSRLTGMLEGTVRWIGAGVPQPTVLENATDPEVCGRVQTLDDLLVSERNEGIQNVIVALADVSVEKIPPRVPGRLLLDNVECRFSPHVAVLTVGSVIETRNSDPTLHTTHLYGPSEVNLAMPLQGMTVSRTAEKAGMIIVKCDVHGWMQAYIRVDDHPFHTVTDGSGFFRIADVPTGEYVLEAWHEKLGFNRRTVRIQDGETSTIELAFPAADQ